MALTACLGMGDEEILQLLPGKFKVSNTLIVGLRSWDEGIKERQKNLGIKGLSPEEVAKDSSSILKWLKGTGSIQSCRSLRYGRNRSGGYDSGSRRRA